jgi:hypothetical protein
MIALWKRKNPIYFGVIRSKVKVTITINRIVYRLIIYIDGCIFVNDLQKDFYIFQILIF